MATWNAVRSRPWSWRNTAPAASPKDALGFAVLNEIDGFLKAHGAFEPYTLTELDRRVQALERLGF